MLRAMDTGSAPAVEVPRAQPSSAGPAAQGGLRPRLLWRPIRREMGGEIPAEGWWPVLSPHPPQHGPIACLTRQPHPCPLPGRGPVRLGSRAGGGHDRYRRPAHRGLLTRSPTRPVDAVANDVTARGRHRREAPPAEPFTYDVVRCQVSGPHAAAGNWHHPRRVPGASSPGPAAAAVGERRALLDESTSADTGSPAAGAGLGGQRRASYS